MTPVRTQLKSDIRLIWVRVSLSVRLAGGLDRSQNIPIAKLTFYQLNYSAQWKKWTRYKFCLAVDVWTLTLLQTFLSQHFFTYVTYYFAQVIHSHAKTHGTFRTHFLPHLNKTEKKDKHFYFLPRIKRLIIDRL